MTKYNVRYESSTGCPRVKMELSEEVLDRAYRRGWIATPSGDIIPWHKILIFRKIKGADSESQ